MKIVFKGLILFSILLFTGCSTNTYNYPSKSEPSSLIKIADDELYMRGIGIFKSRSLYVYRINDQHVGANFSEVEKIRVKPGLVKLMVQEDNRKFPRVYSGEIKFIAKEGEEYLLTSKHVFYNGVFDIIFMIYDSNNKLVSYDE